MEILLFAALAIGAMFLMSRSSRKKQQASVAFRDDLQPGQEVMTGSGYFGTVVSVADDVVTLESTPGNRSRWLRAAIAKQVDPVSSEGEAVAAEAAQTDAGQKVDIEKKQAFTIPDDISGLIEKPKPDDTTK
ncbi:preprotein translocase subunit YajC [Sanguibacter antarcticus]|uniref:Preprotein translocase subunit YajC n=1 Tax=Sanguibacter antarcticus TaxID=372484 RepID=A0A2A9E4F5_9MICO|nr:preprotein translocase subunit YajC [Sanguibacter antarcticus]PFG33069.1 preprotein translocase subunit YajC [Sanguibacter antarcticus]